MPSPFAPAFIFGVPRSGTTLLVNLVGAHPLVAPLYETRFLRNLVRFCARASWSRGNSAMSAAARFLGGPVMEAYFHESCNHFRRKVLQFDERRPGLPIFYTPEELAAEVDLWLAHLQKTVLSRDEIFRSARAFVDRLFAVHCQRMNKSYWINKTPGLLNHLDGLGRLYPGARCIHIIRDGRDVAVSNLARDWGPTNIHEAARRWKDLMLQGWKGLASKRLSYCEIRYEDLIHSPENTFTQVLRFLELDGDARDILARFTIRERGIGRWRTAFKPEDRKTFAAAAGDLLIKLGYEKDYRWV